MRTQTISNSSKPTPARGTMILNELSIEEAALLKLQPGLSIAATLYVPFDTDEQGKTLSTPEMLSIDEIQDFGTPYEVSKLPAGSMNHEDANVFATAIRELFSETGYIAQSWEIVRAVETSSTIPGERHIKVFLVGKNAVKRGEPTEKCILRVNRISMTTIHQKGMVRNQRIGFRKAVESIKFINANFALSLMNHNIPDWIAE